MRWSSRARVMVRIALCAIWRRLASAAAIHGDKSQNARQAALDSFKRGENKVLVATDIAARGIDIAGLSHVFNYDLPNEPEAYVHRIGRTGRAGHTGKAISFCCIDELKQLGQIEKLIRRRLPVKESDWPMVVTTPSEPKPRTPRAARPAKVDMRGNAIPERKPSARPAPNRKPASRAGQPITIGKDGRMKPTSSPSQFKESTSTGRGK